MRRVAREQVDPRLLTAAVMAWLAVLWIVSRWNLPGGDLFPTAWSAWNPSPKTAGSQS